LRGFCVGCHAVEDAGDELGMGASATCETELPGLRGGEVVVVDRLIHGAGIDLAVPVAVDRRGDVAEQPGQLRLIVGAHPFAGGAPFGTGFDGASHRSECVDRRILARQEQTSANHGA
jgi:hypothetical protein